MKNKLIIKIISVSAALLLMLPCISACHSVPHEKSVVGTVDGKDVYYDEVYYLASGYKASVLAEYGSDTEGAQAEMDRLIKENILVNYGRLKVCENLGLKYKDIEGDIDEAIENKISSDFESKQDFEDSLKESGMTRRYYEFIVGIELLGENLILKYAENGLTLGDEKIPDHIKENFVLVRQLVLFNDEGESLDENRAKLEEALTKIEKGDSLIELIGKGYSEDFSDIGSGYCFPKGSMNDDYEKVAFELRVGETSEIFQTKAVSSSTGENVDCLVILQRYAITDDYIDKNFDTLKDEYINSVVNADYQRIIDELTFEPNGNYSSLNLLELDEPRNFTTVVIIIASVSATVLVAAAIIVIVVIKKNLKKKNVSYRKKK